MGRHTKAGYKKSVRGTAREMGKKKGPGGYLLSRGKTAVPSAWRGLTSVFGMGTGMAPSLWPPGRRTAGSTAVRPPCALPQTAGTVMWPSLTAD